jgi:hypothetical protein
MESNWRPMRTLASIALSLLILAGNFNIAGEMDVDRPEERRVVSALFAHIAKEAPHFKFVLAPRSIVIDRSGEELKRALPEASDVVIEDLLVNSNKPVSTQPISGLPPDVEIVIATREQLDKIFDRQSPRFSAHRFNREFPGATRLIHLSRVGIDPKTGQAAIFMADICGSLCGAGYLILLHHDGSDWTRIKFTSLWVS